MKLRLLSKLIAIWLSLYLLIGGVGCAYKYQPPPSEDVRSKLGTVGIIFESTIPESNFSTFAKGRLAGAGKGAAGGATVGATVGISAGPIGILLLPFLAGGGAVIGGVAGATGAVPTSDAEKIETAISSALSALRIQETMSGHMVRASRELVNYRFYPEPVLHEKTSDYGVLKGKGIDTAMEVFVESVGFEGGEGSDPAIALFMNLRERLVRTSDSAVLYENRFIYRSAQRRFTRWYESNAMLLSQEFDQAYRSLAEKVVEETFLRYNLSKWPSNMF